MHNQIRCDWLSYKFTDLLIQALLVHAWVRDPYPSTLKIFGHHDEAHRTSKSLIEMREPPSVEKSFECFMHIAPFEYRFLPCRS
jgi:hypothetical protein